LIGGGNKKAFPPAKRNDRVDGRDTRHEIMNPDLLEQEVEAELEDNDDVGTQKSGGTKRTKKVKKKVKKSAKKKSE